MKRRLTVRRRSAFTLLEVLLVLAILVILGSTVTFFYAKTQTSANIKAARVQINSFSGVMDQYRIDVGSYPGTQQGLSALMSPPADLAAPDRWSGPYLREQQMPADPWNNPYQYELVDADTFRIWSFGPDMQDGTQDDISNL